MNKMIHKKSTVFLFIASQVCYTQKVDILQGIEVAPRKGKRYKLVVSLFELPCLM